MLIYPALMKLFHCVVKPAIELSTRHPASLTASLPSRCEEEVFILGACIPAVHIPQLVSVCCLNDFSVCPKTLDSSKMCQASTHELVEHFKDMHLRPSLPRSFLLLVLIIFYHVAGGTKSCAWHFMQQLQAQRTALATRRDCLNWPVHCTPC